MSVDNLNLFSNKNVSEDWEKGEDCWHGRFSIDDQEWYMIDFETIGEIVHSCASLVCMSDDNDLVAAIYQLGG